MPPQNPEKSNSRFILGVCVDLLFPWAGTALTRKAPAGRWGIIFWMAFQLIIVMWVLTMTLELPQALIILTVAWLVAQIWIQSKSFEAHFHSAEPDNAAQDRQLERGWGRHLSIAMVILVYVITPVMFVTRIADHYTTVRVDDVGMFPTLLQDETVVTWKWSAKNPWVGGLVVWNSKTGPAIGRVVAVGGSHVEVTEGLVTVDGKPSTTSRRTAMTFDDDVPLNARESIEGEGLNFFSEEHMSAKYATPAYIRPGVYTAASSVDVPEGSVFILNDNRTASDSIDSREVGPVSIKEISGIPIFVIWSAGGGLMERLDRIGVLTR